MHQCQRPHVPPDDIELFICKIKVLLRLSHRSQGMGRSMMVGGKALLLDIVLVIVMQHGAACKFFLINVPSKQLGKLKAPLRYLHAVSKRVAPVVLREITESVDLGIQDQFIQFSVEQLSVICHNCLPSPPAAALIGISVWRSPQRPSARTGRSERGSATHWSASRYWLPPAAARHRG